MISDDETTPPRGSDPAPLRLVNGPTMTDSQRTIAEVVKMLTDQVRPEERRHVEKLRNEVDPVAALFRIGEAVGRLKRDADTGERERAKQTEVLLALPARVTELETTITGAKNRGWKMVGAVLATLIASSVAIVSAIENRSEERGRWEERLDNLRDEVRTLRQYEREGRPRTYHLPPGWPAPPTQSPKDQP